MAMAAAPALRSKAIETARALASLLASPARISHLLGQLRQVLEYLAHHRTQLIYHFPRLRNV